MEKEYAVEILVALYESYREGDKGLDGGQVALPHHVALSAVGVAVRRREDFEELAEHWEAFVSQVS